ncbi:MAG: conjugal transfer protein TraX [Clostridia bacterium]|nr:conjugal transfer protein TraX [Clostridia bacterium]
MTSCFLKILACILMLVDHIGFCFFPKLIILRKIGRLAFPIFAFQIAVGFSRTSNKKKYILRMLIFALVSEIPFLFFRVASGYTEFRTNIGFSFFISLLCLYLIDSFQNKKNILYLFLIIPLIASAVLLKVDYSFLGPVFVILFYLFGQEKKYFPILFITAIYATLIYVLLLKSDIQLYCLISLFIILLYNGKKGPNLKYLFYIFYPAHFLILGILNYLMV